MFPAEQSPPEELFHLPGKTVLAPQGEAPIRVQLVPGQLVQPHPGPQAGVQVVHCPQPVPPLPVHVLFRQFPVLLCQLPQELLVFCDGHTLSSLLRLSSPEAFSLCPV